MTYRPGLGRQLLARTNLARCPPGARRATNRIEAVRSDMAKTPALMTFSEGTKCALAGGFDGGGDGGPIQRGAITGHFHGRKGYTAARPIVAVQRR